LIRLSPSVLGGHVCALPGVEGGGGGCDRVPGWTGAPVGGGDRATSHVCHGWKYHSSEMGPHPQGTITHNSYSIYSCTLLVYYLYTTCMLFLYYLYTICILLAYSCILHSILVTSINIYSLSKLRTVF